MISKDLYEFYVNDLNISYEGKIEGVGEAYSHLITTKDTIPCDLSENIDGEFYQPDYISVVTPKPAKPNEELSQEILKKIITIKSDGTYGIWDAQSQRTLQFGKNINSKIEINGNALSIEITDDMGNCYQYSTDNYLNYIEDLQYSMPGTQISFDLIGLGTDFLEYKYERMTKSQQLDKLKKVKSGTEKIVQNIGRKLYSSKNHSQIERKIHKTFQKIPTKGLNKKIPKMFKKGGRMLGAVGAGFIAYDMWDSEALKASHALDAVMMGVSFCGPWGAAAGGVYFVVDLGLMYFTDNSIGDYLDGFLNDNTSFSDGILYDFQPLFDDVREWWYDFDIEFSF